MLEIPGPVAWLGDHAEVGAIGLAVLVVAWVVVRRVGGGAEPAYLEEVRSLAAQGRFREAGDLQLKHGALPHAFNIFSRGEVWDRASFCAERMGNTEGAAEFAERAKEFERAAELYEKVDAWNEAARAWRAAGRLEDVARVIERNPECSAAERAQAWEAAYHDVRARGDAARLQEIGEAAGRAFIKAGDDAKARYFGAETPTIALVETPTRVVEGPAPIPAEPRQSSSLLPSHDNRYILEGKLGEGGMGVVYRARDRVLDRPVALKVLPEAVTAEDIARKLFEREARAAAALSHPNIVVVYDFGLIEGRPFLSMELLECGSLAEALEQHPGGLPLPLLETAARDLLAAVAFAHAAKTVHRDIKPANLLLTAQDRIKLTDFGIAKMLDTSTNGSTMVAGTPAYMSPEQLEGNGVDHRTDVFATGVTLYELATGRRPFVGAARDRSPAAPRTHRPELATEFDAMIMACLELDPEQRPQSAADVIARIPAVAPPNVLPFRRERPRLEYSMQRGEVIRVSS